MQLARHYGADVTAVCNTKNLELVRSLGADRVIDYTREDFTRNGETYDVVFDAVGKHSFRRCRHSLKPGGTYVETDLGFMWHVPVLALATRWIGDKRVTLGITRYTKEDVLFLKELIEAGSYRAVIDRRYPLEDVVEATRYVETEQKTGNVVLTIDGGKEGQMSRLINTTTMTVDGVTDVGEWYVSEGEHDGAARDQFVGAAGMVFGRKTYEGLAAYWPEQSGPWGTCSTRCPSSSPRGRCKDRSSGTPR